MGLGIRRRIRFCRMDRDIVTHTAGRYKLARIWLQGSLLRRNRRY
jgi:hypothetical protein